MATGDANRLRGPSLTVLSATGGVTPVGAGVEQTLTSVRAGLRRVVERADIYSCLPEDPRLDPSEPLKASAVYHLDPADRAAGRMPRWLGRLAGEACRDMALNGRLTAAQAPRLGVYLALPTRPGVGPDQRDELLYHFHNHAELDLLANVRLHFGGHAAVLALLDQASRDLAEGQVELAAVGGADSWLFEPWLAAADRDWKLRSSRNPDGFQPGEGAAFLLLERPGAPERRGVAPLATLGAQRSGRAVAASTGAELAALLEPLLPAEPPLVVCDLNGTSARAREWGFAVARLGRSLADGWALEHPAAVLGDTGAASGALAVALAAHGLRAHHADRRVAVVWSASDDGERRALSLERA